jgi:hypothetical protein
MQLFVNSLGNCLLFLDDVVYVFVLLVGRGYLGWKYLGCLVAALFQVNHYLSF